MPDGKTRGKTGKSCGKGQTPPQRRIPLSGNSIAFCLKKIPQGGVKNLSKKYSPLQPGRAGYKKTSPEFSGKVLILDIGKVLLAVGQFDFVKQKFRGFTLKRVVFFAQSQRFRVRRGVSELLCRRCRFGRTSLYRRRHFGFRRF